MRPGSPGRIRARYRADTITAYQAYSPQIAVPAVAAGRFVAPWRGSASSAA